MKNLIRIFNFGLVALALTACGSNNSNNSLSAYNQYGSGQPLTSGSTLSFTATGAQVSSTGVWAGYLPGGSSPGTHGQVVMGGAYNTIYNVGQITMTKYSNIAGLLQLNVSPNGSVSGTIQFNPQVANALLAYGPQGYTAYNQSPYTTPYTGIYTGAAVTVQSVGIDAVYNPTSYSTGTIIQALVYVTLSTGQTVGPIPFY